MKERTEIPRPADQGIINTTQETVSQNASHTTTTLASTSQENAINRVEITTFQDVEAPALASTPMVQNTTSIAHFDNTFDIKQFLARPVKIDHFQIKVGSGRTLNEYTFNEKQPYHRAYDLPSKIFQYGGKLDKIKNHQYFKADIHIKLVLNTNPFVSGRLYLTYSPYENTITEDRQQIWSSRSGVTAYPGVEIDVQLDNSVEITIPYSSYKESYVVTIDDSDYLKLYLFGITDILGTKDSRGTVDVAVYAWFENIDLNIPTLKIPDALVETKVEMTQEEQRLMYLGSQIDKLKVTNKSMYDYVQGILNPIKRRARMQIQAEAKEKGPVENISGIVGGIADAVGRIPIPIVSEIANGVGWISDIVGGIASIFGWSKPHSYTQNTPFSNLPGKNFTHIEGEDQSTVLALSGKNELDKPLGIFPSAIDEMSLAYVASNPSIKYVETWSSKGAAGEIFITKPILLIPVGIGCFNGTPLKVGTIESTEATYKPDNISGCGVPVDSCITGHIPYMAYRKDETGMDVYSTKISLIGTSNRFLMAPTPCEYVSQLFRYWRATLCYKISVVKTAFHTGRLEIFFDPGWYHSIPGTTFLDPDLSKYTDADTTNNYKYILDLTNDSEVTIRIPFVSEKLFLETAGFGARYITPQQVMNSIIGALVIRPVTDLMAPATVASEVKVVVWKWAEDVVFSCPTAASDVELAIYDREEPPVPPKIKIEDVEKHIIENLPVENADDPKNILMEVKACMQINIGNKADGNVQTFFNTIDIEQENMKACAHASGERLVNFRPLLRVFKQHKLYTDNPIKDKLIFQDMFGLAEMKKQPDYLSYLSYMYRFFRGGVRYKYFSAELTDIPVVSHLLNEGDEPVSLAPTHITYPRINPVHEISVPFYTQFRKLPIGSTVGMANCHISGNKGILYRAGNDDFTYGWLMGVPQTLAGDGAVKWNFIRRKGDATEKFRIQCDDKFELIEKIHPQS